MKVIFVTSEAVPYVKTGSLADTTGSLARELGRQGVETSIILPLYRKVEETFGRQLKYMDYFYVEMGLDRQYAGVVRKKEAHTTVYFIDSRRYFDRPGIYGELDDGERFFFFNKAAVQLIKELDLKPDIVHANDWQTGMVPLYLKDFGHRDPYYKDIKSCYTVYNIENPGYFPARYLTGIGGLSQKYFTDDGVKSDEFISFQKAGIVYSDHIFTTSETYGEELKDPEYGNGFDKLIRKYDEKFTGIMNGIDFRLYDPKHDPLIGYNYDSKTLRKKRRNKSILQRKFGLPSRNVPVFSVVSRLTEAKGMDFILKIVDELFQEDVQLVILGTGERKYEEVFWTLEDEYPDKFSAGLYYSEEDAHSVYAGSDFLLMPALTEPGGQSQMIAQRYGTIPIVRNTGGLADTVTSYNRITKKGTGLTFENPDSEEFLKAVERGLELYHTEYEILAIQCMEADNSWEKAAGKYIELYEQVKNK